MQAVIVNRVFLRLSVVALAFLAISDGGAIGLSGEQTTSLASRTPSIDFEGTVAARWLQDAFAGQKMPEGAEMLLAIARGSRLGPGEGWFHPGQSRYGWPWLAKLHGVAPDGAISADSFKGPAELFDRLDRNHDKVLRADDFDWSERSRPVAALATSEPLDRLSSSGDGRISREDWMRVFDQAADGKDHLTAAELRDALGSKSNVAKSPNGMPSHQVLVRGLFRGEVGSMNEGPKVDDPAPDFTLRNHDGSGVVRLSDHFGKRPIVLSFGNFTCRPFRSTYPHVDELATRYKSEALFLGVYVREAHPTDGWRMSSNDAAGVALAQPQSYPERVAVANTCSSKLKMSIPLLVDEIDDRVGNAYSGMPGRLYLIDPQGRIAYKGGRGPFGFKPAELEQALVLLLLDTANGAQSDASTHPAK
jgi:hypothetical protein